MRRAWMCLCVLSLGTAAQAGVHRWTSTGPEGGHALQILPVPDVQGSVWALVLGRPFRSTDGAATWVERSAGLPFPVGLSFQAEELLLDRSQPGTMLARGGGGELYRSTDDGGSWTRILDGSSLGSSFSLAGSDSAPGTFYVAPSPATRPVLRSTDHGATWAPSGVPIGTTFNDFVEEFAVDPANSNLLYGRLQSGRQAVLRQRRCRRELDPTRRRAPCPERATVRDSDFTDDAVGL